MVATAARGKLAFHLFAALAEFERGVIRERTLAGLRAAGRAARGGDSPHLGPRTLAVARSLLQDPGITVHEVARRLGVAASTLSPPPCPSAAGVGFSSCRPSSTTWSGGI